MSTSSALFKGYLFVIISSLADATSPIIGKISCTYDLTPPELFFLRHLFSFFLFTGYLLAKRKQVICISPLVIIQGLLLITHELLFYYALRLMPASTGTIIFYTYPILVALLSIILFREKPVPIFYFGLIMAFVGVALMCGFWDGTTAISSKGLIIDLAATVLCALFTLVGQKTTVNIEPMQLMGTFSFISLVFCGILCPHAVSSLAGGYTIQQIGLGISAGIINNLIGLVCFLKAISYIGASKTSLGCTLEPVMGVLLAVVLLHEPFTSTSFIGAAMVVLSIILTLPGSEEQIKKCLRHFHQRYKPDKSL